MLTPIIDVNRNQLENSVFKIKIDESSELFRTSIENIKHKNKRNDVIFLIDSSSSIGKQNFYSEIKFVKKLLSDFNVSYNYTRVALITFSSQAKIIRHIDQISNPSEDNDKCSLLNDEIPQINFVGGGTFTYGAFKEAQEILKSSRLNSKKYIFLVTDGFSNGKDPIPIATKLKEDNVTIFTIGILSGNVYELYNISSEPKHQYHFVLESFPQFEGLARRALRADYRIGQSLKLNDKRCEILCQIGGTNSTQQNSCCDENADCTCGTSSGHYACICHAGYYGSGKKDECYVCPNGTYWHHSKMCRPCPDINHITLEQPALDINYCVCKAGWRKGIDNRCEGITCPKLIPPENGYFVKQSSKCANVLNSACGVRCKSGYQLLGTSLRVCQENGTWSGIEATCSLKLCPSLTVPYYGQIVCRNRDLDLYFDYSPRNSTFMETYEDETKRYTEPMPIDTECTYKCGPGHYLVGSRVRNCLPLSKWDGLQTTCKQVLCPPLPKPLYGEYELSDCTEMKVPHGTNCTLICPLGFDIEGPETKSCIGKKTGLWTHKNKIPKCVDTTPPKIVCPEDINITAVEDSVIINTLPPPLHLSDSSGMSISFWTQPMVNETIGIKLRVGEHFFIYSASDTFHNKAECIFKINVIDETPPIVENCINPEEFYISSDKAIIEWDEPKFYDNSNFDVKITKSLKPGEYLGIGLHQDIYVATDLFGNSNECVLNITVKEKTCNVLSSPLNGHSVCAKNLTHTWCEINCKNGYAIFNDDEESFLENFQVTCINNEPKWKYEVISDCTPVDLPNSIEQLLTISLDSEDGFCNNLDAKEEFQQNFTNQVKKHLCNNLDDCNIISNIPECFENNETNDIFDKNYYNIVKRDLSTQQITNRNNKNKTRNATVRVKILTKIGKRLGLWKRNQTVSDNIRIIRNELKTLNANEQLKTILQEMQIDVKKLKIEEFTRCSDGSVSKKHLCVQCPRGTYHNVPYNRCQPCPIGTYNNEFSQITCVKCPLHYTTKKIGRQSVDECKQVCPPGTVAKIKTLRKNLRPESVNRKSLMPFCQKCSSGEYQPNYDQINCLACPDGYTSQRGSESINACYPKDISPCQTNPSICGSFGYCVPNQSGNNLFTCVCQNGYYGARCEFQIDFCLSAPCYNNGHCYYTNQTTIACQCPPKFVGKFCEELKYSCKNIFCRNGGTCIETVEGAICECSSGYEGDFCEKDINNCIHSPCEVGQCTNTIDGYYCQCPPGFMGKRCHLRPCDYLPCHKNAICIDLPHYPTTRNSFTCNCPKGLKGYNCTQIHNPCDSQPCKNNGECIPFVLKQINNSYSIDLNNLNEDDYEKYTCKCQPYFYGDNCEIFTTPDFVMEFSQSSVTSFVELNGPIKSLTEISFCFWIKTNDSFNYGSILSYATENVDNMFTFTDYNGFVLYVHGNHTVTDMVVNDGHWHFICASWMSQNGFYEIYLDGILKHTGINLSSGEKVENQGTFIIGQEQDQKGGSFSETESFIGSIAYFDIWDNFLTGLQVREYYHSCEPYQGSLYSWTDFKSKVHGDVQIKPSQFCLSCPTDLSLAHGSVQILGNRAYYQCDVGYILQGNQVRICLRTSEWSRGYPYCQIIDCHTPPSIENGFIEYSKTIYDSEVKYYCNNGFTLKGDSTRKCRESGIWTGKTPECTSTVKCKRFNEHPYMTAYYGNYRGMLSSNLSNFPVGTFVEIFCTQGNQTTEAIMTCLENGQWDGTLPILCTGTSTTPFDYKKLFQIKTHKFQDVEFSTENELDGSINSGQLDLGKNREATDTTTYQTSTATIEKAIATNQYPTTTRELVSTTEIYTLSESHFLNTTKIKQQIISDYETITQPKLEFQSTTMSSLETVHHNETSTSNGNFYRPEEIFNVDTKFFYTESIIDAFNEDPFDTEDELEKDQITEADQCSLKNIPIAPRNIVLIGIKSPNGDLYDFSDINKDGSHMVQSKTKIIYNCTKNYESRYDIISECKNDGNWSPIKHFCDLKWCEDLPEINSNMFYSRNEEDSKFEIGHKLQLKCNNGFTIHGNSEIICLKTGKWTRVLARCTRISCGKPKLPTNAKIIKGRSYLFENQIQIECNDGTIVGITCQENGNWNSTAICL